MNRTVAIIAARMGSTRFPGKVLMPLRDEFDANTRVLGHVIAAAKRTIGIEEVVVATTREERDNPIVDYCKILDTPTFRGSEDDVLERFYSAAVEYDADAVVRLTGDCPLLDAYVISEVVMLYRRSNVSFCNNTEPPTYPDGLDVEVMSMDALEAAHFQAVTKSDRDCLSQWISRHQHHWPAKVLINPIPGLDNERWVLDTEEDYQFCQKIFERLGGYVPSLPRILDILRKEPELREINAKWKRNERFYAQIAQERAS